MHQIAGIIPFHKYFVTDYNVILHFVLSATLYLISFFLKVTAKEKCSLHKKKAQRISQIKVIKWCPWRYKRLYNKPPIHQFQVFCGQKLLLNDGRSLKNWQNGFLLSLMNDMFSDLSWKWSLPSRSMFYHPWTKQSAQNFPGHSVLFPPIYQLTLMFSLFSFQVSVTSIWHFSWVINRC